MSLISITDQAFCVPYSALKINICTSALVTHTKFHEICLAFVKAVDTLLHARLKARTLHKARFSAHAERNVPQRVVQNTASSSSISQALHIASCSRTGQTLSSTFCNSISRAQRSTSCTQALNFTSCSSTSQAQNSTSYSNTSQALNSTTCSNIIQALKSISCSSSTSEALNSTFYNGTSKALNTRDFLLCTSRAVIMRLRATSVDG